MIRQDHQRRRKGESEIRHQTMGALHHTAGGRTGSREEEAVLEVASLVEVSQLGSRGVAGDEQQFPGTSSSSRGW